MVRAVAAGAMLVMTALPVWTAGASGLQQGLAGPAEGESLEAWTERWMDGPVSLFVTEEEHELYASLQDIHERLHFIRLFWQRRDPRPRGPRNEYLDEFARRLEYVEDNFAEDGEPGWETIFGKVVMHFGVPDRTRRELGLSTEMSSRPPILWSYDDPPEGLPVNEDLMFVFQVGRWRLAPPSGFGDSGVSAAIRQMERSSVLGGIPSEYEEAMDRVRQESLMNPVDYGEIQERVASSVMLPDSQIPFSWTAMTEPAAGGRLGVAFELSWRVDALVFHAEGEEFRTDMVVDVRLLDDGELVADTTDRIEIRIPAEEMDSRRETSVSRTVGGLTVAPGTYDVEIVLLDQLLGYRTVYEDILELTR